MSARLLIDISQFAGYPILTGIQRTLLSLARYWPAGEVTAEIGFRYQDDSRYTIAPLRSLWDASFLLFADRAREQEPGYDGSRRLREYLSSHATAHLDPQEIPETFDGYLICEAAFEDHVLDTVDYCAESMGHRCMAFVHDAIPQTHPEVIPNPHLGWTDRYFLTLAKIKSLAFNSEESKRIFESRLSRSPVPNAVVIPLGADGLGRESTPVPASPSFVVVGTVEPRKRYDLILDAFDHLWQKGRDYHLSFLGMPGCYPPDKLENFRQRAREERLFDWHESAEDSQLQAAIRSATAGIFVSELEGFGLPPLEALALGCPVIVTTHMPALEGLPENGQIRLATVTKEILASAVDQMADPAENARLREAISHLELRSWQQTVAELAAWVGETLRGSGR